jgi:hypothetical protein
MPAFRFDISESALCDREKSWVIEQEYTPRRMLVQ